MKKLPIGIQDFRRLRTSNLLYVDKTKHLLELIENGDRYFLSRPRRFGKSLTLSTLDAMFSGQFHLFSGLFAENWVRKQSQYPSPVLRFDMSRLRNYENAQELNEAIILGLEDFAFMNDFQLKHEKYCNGTLLQVIYHLYKAHGYVVILIDEYDKPILDNIRDLRKSEEMRDVLRSFYTTIKSCDEFLRFVMISGISKFSKAGVFSAMNNLLDITFVEKYSDIMGYTQNELESYFPDWINAVSSKMNINHSELLSHLKEYYDGFSFDGKIRLYNPFSILSFFATGEFGNYWYESGSPSFIVNWMKEHKIDEPENYRHVRVRQDFTSSQEIERANPTSFLFQSGYLTVEKKEGQNFILDYPNFEVINSLSGMYLELVYHVEQFASLGAELWRALNNSDIHEIIRLFNTALAVIPYDDFPNRNEFWYRSLFLMLLRGAGIIAHAEVHTYKGRSDLLIQFDNSIIVLEFKFAAKSSEVSEMRDIGLQQINDREYAKGYASEGRNIITAVLVADDQRRQIIE